MGNSNTPSVNPMCERKKGEKNRCAYGEDGVCLGGNHLVLALGYFATFRPDLPAVSQEELEIRLRKALAGEFVEIPGCSNLRNCSCGSECSKVDINWRKTPYGQTWNYLYFKIGYQLTAAQIRRGFPLNLFKQEDRDGLKQKYDGTVRNMTKAQDLEWNFNQIKSGHPVLIGICEKDFWGTSKNCHSLLGVAGSETSSRESDPEKFKILKIGVHDPNRALVSKDPMALALTFTRDFKKDEKSGDAYRTTYSDSQWGQRKIYSFGIKDLVNAYSFFIQERHKQACKNLRLSEE